MKELFEEGFQPSPLDPNESARQGVRPVLRRRFYKNVSLAEEAAGFSLALDGKAVRTPAKRVLLAPKRPIAEAIAAEWEAQQETIDPASMPLTRLANSIIDGVADRSEDVRDDIAAYFGSDLLFYRADGPEALIERQNQHWEPVLRWAADEFGARFVLAQGIVHVAQPEPALQAARGALPSQIWTVGALHSVTTLTGSALLALALWKGFRDADATWAAAHVDEDWNFDTWGADEAVLAKRRARQAELRAAERVLKAMGA